MTAPLNPYAAPTHRTWPLPQVVAGLDVATPRSRLAARIIDSVLFYVPLLLPTVGGDGVAYGLAVAACVLLFLSIPIAQAMLIATTGASIGKRLCGIKMIRCDGGEVGFVRGWVVRSLVFGLVETILGFMFLCIPSVVDALFVFTKTGRTLHDRVAGTIVVKASR